MDKQKGSISLFLVAFLILVVFGIGILDIDDQRLVLADEITSGRLIETAKSKQLLRQVDSILEEKWKSIKETRRGKKRPEWKTIWDNWWQSIFLAKVMMDRARLDMEMKRR